MIRWDTDTGIGNCILRCRERYLYRAVGRRILIGVVEDIGKDTFCGSFMSGQIDISDNVLLQYDMFVMILFLHHRTDSLYNLRK